jgi:hypothetical protein
MHIRNLILALILTAASAFAADIDGKWTGSIETPNGAVNVGFTFMADGATLTGTSTSPDGTDAKISDGKIDGNKLSFSVTVDFGGMPFTIAYTGELSGTNLKLTADFGGMPFEMALKKA